MTRKLLTLASWLGLELVDLRKAGSCCKALLRVRSMRRIIDVLYLVSVNLLRNPRRAILTTMAIAVSIFVLSVLLSLPAIADQVL